MPSATQVSGSSARLTGRPVAWRSTKSRLPSSAPPPGQHDALVDDVGGQLGRGVLERDLDRLDDRADRLGQRLGDLALC